MNATIAAHIVADAHGVGVFFRVVSVPVGMVNTIIP